MAMDTNRRKSTLPSSSASRLPDPRNISDKNVMNIMVKRLSEFLIQYGYEGAVAPKILIRPSSKDFLTITTFLFKTIDPNCKLVGKFEEEVVNMFKFLGYPFVIAKSSISAVGSPHAWPSLLAALTWLIELIEYNNRSEDADKQANLDLDYSSSERGFYAYCGKAYGLFITGKDDAFLQLENQFVKSFDDKNVLINDQIEAVDKRNGAIAAEIEQIKNRSEHLPELVAKKKEFQSTLSQFTSLVNELGQVRKQIYDKVENRKAELESVMNGIASLEEKIHGMKVTIQNQDLSPEDVLNLVTERKRLEDANTAATETRQNLQRKIKEMESDLRVRVQALEDSVRVYHSYAEGLKLVPASARNARGQDLGIDIDIRAKKREGLLRTEVRNHILPILAQMKAELTETTLELRAEKMREQEAMDEIEAQRSEILESQSALEAKQRKAEAGYKREKELHDQSAAIHSTELDTMEARLMQLRDTAAEEAKLTATKRRIAEITSLRAARKTEHDRKVAAMKESIMEVVVQCADHREMVQQQLEALKSQYASRLQSLLSTSPAEGDDYNGYNGDGYSSMIEY